MMRAALSCGRPQALITPARCSSSSRRPSAGRLAVRASAAKHEQAAPPTAAVEPLSPEARHRSFLLAQERLVELLEEAKLSNKDTVPVDYLDALAPEERLTLFTNLGTLALLAEVMWCWLFGEADPLGGMDFNAASLYAAAAGAAYALPLIACSVAARSRGFRARFPVLEQLHGQQAALQRHFTDGLNVAQIGILLSFIVVPSLLMLLPAARAGCCWGASFAQHALLQTWASGLHIPRLPLAGLAGLAAPLVGAYAAASAASRCFGVRPKQLEMLRDALRNREAYFRLAAARTPPPLPAASGDDSSSSRSSRRARAGQQLQPPSVFASSGSLTLDVSAETATDDDDEGAAAAVNEGQEEDDGAYSAAQAAADAFSMLAMVWLVSRRHVAKLAGLLTGGSVLYLGALWGATGDMSTPLVAALLHAAVEVWYGQEQEQQQ